MTRLSARPRPADRLDVRDLVSPSDPEARPLGPARARLGERPLWDAADGALVWVDIDGCAVHRWAGGDPARGTVLSTPSQVGVAWPAASGGMLLATADGLGVHDGTRLGPLTRPDGMPADHRFNDGGCDPAGRFWAATMPGNGSVGDGAVHRVVADGDRIEVTTVLTGVGCGNGLAWSPDGGTLYLTDSGTRTLYRLPYDVATGTAGEPEPFLAFVDGDGDPMPDGTAVDADGGLWVALYGGGHVLRFASGGTPLGAVRVPTSDVTCPGFGAPGAGRLFVTTAGHGGGGDRGDRTGPPGRAGDGLAGAVFGADVPVDGLPVRVFADA